MTGALRPGTFIRLDETAAQLGVSITPVREALLTLRGEGMVQLQPRRGYVVVPMSRQDIADIYWLQATIAEELAVSAVERLSDAQIAELEHANDELARAVVDGDAATITAAEFGFHRLFNRATGRVGCHDFCCTSRATCPRWSTSPTSPIGPSHGGQPPAPHRRATAPGPGRPGPNRRRRARRRRPAADRAARAKRDVGLTRSWRRGARRGS